jgi:hypothetical protein
MIGRFMALVLALGAGPALAQPQARPQAEAPPRTYTQDQLWSRTDQRIIFTPARISFSQRAGALSLRSMSEISHQGEGLDNALQYKSADERVFATVYVYYPPLSHAGLSAFATEQGLRLISEGRLEPVADRLVSAGGTADAAVRIDYRGYRGNMASSAAFLKAERWIVKIRVSGPEDRRGEVEAAMTALLNDIRFEGDISARPAQLLAIEACAAPPSEQARTLADDENVFGDTLIATFDGGGERARPSEPGGAPFRLPARFGSSWCLSTRARIGDQNVPILRATGPGPAASGGSGLTAQSVAVAVISDSGTLLEVVKTDEHRFTLLYHRIGETMVLAAFASPPTDEQIAAVLSGSDRDGGRIRGRVTFPAVGGANIILNSLPGLSARPTT